MAAAAQDEFVDLYEVLELPTEADSETIRKRLNTLYLEAQQNLDHRNVKKRLQFQQMYEIYLPQARHLLLDKRRRAEYDLYLNAYRTGRKVEAQEEEAVAAVEPPPSGAEVIDDSPLPGMVEEEVDPEVLAAEREDMWAKWKQGLQLVTEEAPADVSLPGTAEASAPPAATPPPAQSTPPSPDVPPFARPSSPGPRPRPTPPAPRSGAAPGRPAPRRGTIPGAEQQEQESAISAEMEKKREQQRYFLIKSSVQNAGLLWGAIYAGGIFLLGCIIMFILDGTLREYPLNLSRSAFAGICFLAVLVASALGGLMARRRAKRRAVGELSQLSLEELLRRDR